MYWRKSVFSSNQNKFEKNYRIKFGITAYINYQSKGIVYNELLTLRNKIENTLNYQLSLINLELYHSNLFTVVLEKSEFINHKFFSDVIDINKKYMDLKVYSEKNRLI